MSPADIWKTRCSTTMAAKFKGVTGGELGNNREVNDALQAMCSDPAYDMNTIFTKLTLISQQYMGCSSWSPQQSFQPPSTFTFQPSGDGSTTKCISHCKRSGFKYAGLYSAAACMCGQSTSGLTLDEEPNCDLPCHEDNSAMCGGFTRFDTRGYRGYASVHLVDRNVAYLGCHVDEKQGFGWTKRKHEADYMYLSYPRGITPLYCAAWCSDRNPNWVGGVQYGQECRCYKVNMKLYAHLGKLNDQHNLFCDRTHCTCQMTKQSVTCHVTKIFTIVAGVGVMPFGRLERDDCCSWDNMPRNPQPQCRSRQVNSYVEGSRETL